MINFQIYERISTMCFLEVNLQVLGLILTPRFTKTINIIHTSTAILSFVSEITNRQVAWYWNIT